MKRHLTAVLYFLLFQSFAFAQSVSVGAGIPQNVPLTATYQGATGVVPIYYYVCTRYPSGYTCGPATTALRTKGIDHLGGSNSVTVNWSPGAPGATGYDVIRQPSQGNFTNSCNNNCAIALNIQAVQYIDNSSAAGTNYPPNGLSQVSAANGQITLNNLNYSNPTLGWNLGGVFAPFCLPFSVVSGCYGGGSLGITQLTGDGTAGPGSGSQVFTLATVNSGPGTCGDSSHVCQITTNGKGLTTSQTQISIGGGSVNFQGTPTPNGIVTDYDSTHIQTPDPLSTGSALGAWVFSLSATSAVLNSTGAVNAQGGDVSASGALNAGVGGNSPSAYHWYDTGQAHDYSENAPSTGYTGSCTKPATAPTTGQVLTATTGGTSCVQAWSTPAAGGVSSVFTRTGAVVANSGDYTVSQVTGAAPLASPAFTGTPTAPNPASSANNTQIPNTHWVFAKFAQLNPATAVAAATVTILPNTPTYANGSSGVGATLTAGSNGALVIDGYTVLLSDRVLINNQASALQNGVYTQTTLGTGGAAYVLTRSADFNTVTAINNAGVIPVTNGTVNSGTTWALDSSISAIGTSAINYDQTNSQPPAIVTINTVPCTVGSSCVIGPVYSVGATFSGGGTQAPQVFCCVTLSNASVSGLKGWYITVDDGTGAGTCSGCTATVKWWCAATGTSTPTSANSINTAGVSISTGTNIRSTTLTDFTASSFTANEVCAVDLSAVANAATVTTAFQYQ